MTTKPLDKARAVGDTTNQVNLFLYQTAPNAALRNMDMPRQVHPGETGQPPVALTLHYLLSAYGFGDDDTAAHALLGDAMRIFNDNAILDRETIQNAFPGNDLFTQVERVRITPQTMSIEEISKLWTAFATHYRVSAAFEVSVVLIESLRPTRAPLPVLSRGQNDSGVPVQANLVPPYPTLLGLSLATPKQPSAQLGENLTLQGHDLSGDSLTAQFSHPLLSAPINVTLTPVTTDAETEVVVALPNDAAAQAAWVPGFYTVALVVGRSSDPTDKTRVTNELPFSLAPRILSLTPNSSAAAGGDFTLTVTCGPQVQPPQRASLLFGSHEILADAHAAATNTLTFLISPVTASMAGQSFYTRLRVNGVDSLLVVDYTQTPPQFDAKQKVTLT